MKLSHLEHLQCITIFLNSRISYYNESAYKLILNRMPIVTGVIIFENRNFIR